MEKYKIQGSKTRESTKLKVVSLKRTRLTKLQPGRQKKKKKKKMQITKTRNQSGNITTDLRAIERIMRENYEQLIC